MSSPLDGRIRKLAREEVADLLGNGPAPATGAQDASSEVADLRAQIEALASRVDALEKTPSAGEQAKTVSRRGTARKETTE
jgi:hypothetical protein